MVKLKNKDIAAALNISTAAVSMALNNKAGVSEETRKRVLDYYKEHAHLQNLNNNSPYKKTILLIIHRVTGEIIIKKPYFQNLISALELNARRNGYSLTISHYDPKMDLAKYINSLNEKQPAGIVLMGTELNRSSLAFYKQLKVPFVLLDGYFTPAITDSVTLDNENTVFQAYQYAYQMGHRKIGYLKSATSISNFTYRFNGFSLARQHFAAKSEQAPVVFKLPPNLDGAKKAMLQILNKLPSKQKLPTCFICDLDYIAIGAMAALKEKGYRIPEDISLIGFDDIDYAKICVPALTTIHLYETDLGYVAIDLLISRIHHPQLANRNVYLTNKLIIRQSVKKIDQVQNK